MALLDDIRAQIAELEKQVKEAEDIINRLKMAGEDTTKMAVQLTQLKQKLERYKKAFGVP